MKAFCICSTTREQKIITVMAPTLKQGMLVSVS